MAFLFRAMTEVWPYEAALADLGFDYHTLGGSAFYSQQEIRDVVNVLSVVEDPLDEVALAGTLRGPFFGLCDDGALLAGAEVRGGLTEGVERAGEIAELSDRDRRVAARARELLGRWRAGSRTGCRWRALVASVLDESGFEAALACEFLGARRLANTRKLVRLARDFDRQENFTLGDFVARLRADMDRPPREEQAATTEEDSPTIRLMSIHQAKGLEFPIVVLPDLNRKPNPRTPFLGLIPTLAWWSARPELPRLPRGPRTGPTTGDSLGWLAFGAIEDEDDRRESLRLFYVATTRARDHLVLSSGLETPSDAGEPAAAYLSNVGSCCARIRAIPGHLPRRCSSSWSGSTGDPAPAWPSCRWDGRPARDSDPGTSSRSRSPSPPGARRRLQEIEEAITTTAILEPGSLVRPGHPPAMIDLDPDPDTPSRAARVGRLICSTLADRGLLLGEPLVEACSRLAARQVPAASTAIRDEAILCLEPWLGSPLFPELREALRARNAIERCVRWMLPWPRDGEIRTVIRGRCDLLYRDRKGFWRPVVVSTHATEQSDCLRLLLAGPASARLGKGPGGPAWWVRIGPNRELEVEPHLAASRAAIDEASPAVGGPAR